MATHLEQELSELMRYILQMADLVIDAIEKSIIALKELDVNLAKEVIENDNQLDKLEILIDNECTKILVTKQPAAADLRLILAILKSNTDLERIGDLASNISKEVLDLKDKGLLKPLIDIPRMSEIDIKMIKLSLEAIIERNAQLAKNAIQMDLEVDNLNIQVNRELFTFMLEKPSTIAQAFPLITVARTLERIGDHGTNIAEKAIYYIEGEDIRHK
ncbi:MAG: phosphate signaling complex protein PhoU [Spirochaetes bacterium]|nr:phosphate signaling complex protein PhoU [Caldisericia bacterium]MBP8992071.1 phosphate signaling complex protein PhoU [Spirochaetota bacterium]HQJ41128.1 phosphate signaling complex protein PhoU [Exilispira sp.]HQM89967.1 phosphate signaling complex protein PhoU [Exilispira sp.]HQQ19351.1 phosphate signaling complex protein PhoU [Exilispira sp.]